VFANILQGAIKEGQILDVYAEELKGLSLQNSDDEYNAYRLLQRYLLYTRIHKGAEYIELIGVNHPNYSKAMKKYDKLCVDVERLNNEFDIAV